MRGRSLDLSAIAAGDIGQVIQCDGRRIEFHGRVDALRHLHFHRDQSRDEESEA